MFVELLFALIVLMSDHPFLAVLTVMMHQLEISVVCQMFDVLSIQ